MLSDTELISIFEDAYAKFHGHHRRSRDPISIVHEYTTPEDREVAAIVAACLAYGNVTSILKSVRTALGALGPHPGRTLRRKESSFGIPASFCHRFTRAEDLEVLFARLSAALREYGSIEAFYSIGKQDAPHVTISSFVRRLAAQPLPRSLVRIADRRSRNLKYLVSDPLQGSACKRLCLFLRWVVRPADGVDLGLWTSVSPSELILPIDTHILKTLQLLRWTHSKTATWKVAEAATEQLRRLNPADPLRYDFALCHLSMSGARLSLDPRVPSVI